MRQLRRVRRQLEREFRLIRQEKQRKGGGGEKEKERVTETYMTLHTAAQWRRQNLV